MTGATVEDPSPPPAITGVPTAVTAFIGRASQGPVDTPVAVQSALDFDREFGGVWVDSALGYAVHQFFANGGREALVVRIENGDAPLTDAQISAPELEAEQRGLWALEKADLFNLLCLPPLTRSAGGDIGAATRVAAADYCRRRRAVFLADPLTSWRTSGDVLNGLEVATWGLAPHENAALYFPCLRAHDAADGGRLAAFAPSGAIAGLIARTDRDRGFWKAPAGTGATLASVSSLTARLTDADNGRLNPLGVNCLRDFGARGIVAWGARTLKGADALASEWKYLPVRRTALYLEESLRRGTTWAVFEPNDEPLWARLRQSASGFLHDLFRQGAFAGGAPRQAYFVKCDRETTSRADVDQGVVNIVVGFAPLKPAEFVVITIRQLAGAA